MCGIWISSLEHICNIGLKCIEWPDNDSHHGLIMTFRSIVLRELQQFLLTQNVRIKIKTGNIYICINWLGLLAVTKYHKLGG